MGMLGIWTNTSLNIDFNVFPKVSHKEPIETLLYRVHCKKLESRACIHN